MKPNSTYNVKQYHPKNQSGWNDFAAKSNQDTFLFQRDFMDYHSDRFQDFSLMVYKHDKLVALLPANSDGKTIYSHQGLTYGGLIYDKSFKTADALNSIKAIILFLQENGFDNLIIKELPSIYLLNQTNNPLSYLTFKLKAEVFRTDLHSVIETSNFKFSSSRKEGYKRGLKHGLKVEESETFDLFWKDILFPNLKKKYNVAPVHSLEEITRLKARFPNNIRQFNVYNADTIVGGTTIFETGNVAHCQYISGNANKNELGSLDFLHMRLIETVFRNKPYFDFGTSNLNNGQNINKGLQFWKEGFGARSIPQNFYKIETKNHNVLETVLI